MDKEIVISKNFKDRYEKLNILHQDVAHCKSLQTKGYIKCLEKDLYVIFDSRGTNGIGILDPETFWKAVMSTEIAAFWDFEKKASLN
ncbi:MAG: hypothetical protein KKA19_02825 [Candidatus Margulisbacteria bacterium]|nr:hypothetical protein [Candidatus Margulisiibacteriota bacterium]